MTEPSGDPTRDSMPPSDGTPAPAPTQTADAGQSSPDVDLGRRGFFRAFAGELIQTAATVAGAAQALQRASAEAAGAILDPASATALLGAPIDAPAGAPAAPRRVPDTVPRG